MVYISPEAWWSPFCLLSPHPRKCLFLSKLNPTNTEAKSILVGLVPRETLLLVDVCESPTTACIAFKVTLLLGSLAFHSSPVQPLPQFLFLQSTAQ